MALGLNEMKERAQHFTIELENVSKGWQMPNNF